MAPNRLRKQFMRDNLLLALADQDTLDKVIEWKLEGPPFGIGWTDKRFPITEEMKMQRQFTIELRVDYADNEKNESMREAVARAARHMFATAALLADQTKPQIAIFSDDYFSGHEQIALLEDTVQIGTDMLNSHGADGDDTVSQELLDALKSR